MGALRRVVVTGLGAVTPLGLDVESFWQALLAGRSAVDYITQFDASDFPVRIAAELRSPELGFSHWLNRRPPNGSYHGVPTL